MYIRVCVYLQNIMAHPLSGDIYGCLTLPCLVKVKHTQIKTLTPNSVSSYLYLTGFSLRIVFLQIIVAPC